MNLKKPKTQRYKLFEGKREKKKKKICDTNSNQKRAGVVILISDKMGFKTKISEFLRLIGNEPDQYP